MCQIFKMAFPELQSLGRWLKTQLYCRFRSLLSKPEAAVVRRLRLHWEQAPQNVLRLEKKKNPCRFVCFPNFHRSGYGEPVPVVASDSCSQLTGVEPDMVFCFCSPSTLRFDVLRILSCFSAHHGCINRYNRHSLDVFLGFFFVPFCEKPKGSAFSEILEAYHGQRR